MKTEADVKEWIEATDEGDDVSEEELSQAWAIVFRSRLDEEDEDIRASAWSHLCSAML